MDKPRDGYAGANLSVKRYSHDNTARWCHFIFSISQKRVKVCGFLTVLVYIVIPYIYLVATRTKLPHRRPTSVRTFNSSGNHTPMSNETEWTLEKNYLVKANRTRVSGYSCHALFNKPIGAREILAARRYDQTQVKRSNRYYKSLTKNCGTFKRSRGYINSTGSRLERNFPIAYSIVAYKDIEQIERLLRAIYRPQNYYCIHMDSKSNKDIVDTIKSITSCFDNVFISKRTVSVVWGTLSVLEAELLCMRELFNKTSWKYFINLTGQEFPLKTNLELVKILTALNGTSLVSPGEDTGRDNFTHLIKTFGNPPYNIRVSKGSTHVVLHREFVQYALFDKRSSVILQWLNKSGILIPDEAFFSTLNFNKHLHVPGTYTGESAVQHLIRYKRWEQNPSKCPSGKRVRNICAIGLNDLQKLKDSEALFANKFFSGFQTLAYTCLEELMFNRTWYQNEQQSSSKRVETFLSKLQEYRT